MSRVWCTEGRRGCRRRVAAAFSAALLVGSYGAGAASARVLPAREPVPAYAAAEVVVSPVLVPPEAPVDVDVDAPAFAGWTADVQVRAGQEWVRAARVTLDVRGRGHVRLARATAGTYDVRAVLGPPVPGVPNGAVAFASAVERFEVTATGLGDPAAYRYLTAWRGAPARWNPCAVVTYRVNASAARPSALGDLREALRRVSYETGIRFRELGTTRQVPGAKGFRYDADLVVAWTDAARTSLLGRDRTAAGGFETPVAGRGGRPRIVHGFVVLDAPLVNDLPPGYGAGPTEGQVLLHELGHALGLDHVDAEHQVMRPRLEREVAALYGAGDLTGLRRIGRGAGCL